MTYPGLLRLQMITVTIAINTASTTNAITIVSSWRAARSESVSGGDSPDSPATDVTGASSDVVVFPATVVVDSPSWAATAPAGAAVEANPNAITATTTEAA